MRFFCSEGRFRRLSLMSLMALWLCACATSQVGEPPIHEKAYNALVEKNTRTTDQYQGFYQTFQARATLMSQELLTAALARESWRMQWNDLEQQKQRDRTMQESSRFTKVLLSFYSPEAEYDDLNKPNTIWKTYLEFDGTKLEGKVRKMPDKFVNIQNLLPHANRFSTVYEVTFSTPTSSLEGRSTKFILTSSLGTAEFSF